MGRQTPPIAFRATLSNDPIETALEPVMKATRHNLLLIVFSAAWLAACGSESDLPPLAPHPPPVAPAPASAIAGARTAAAAEKLIDPVEVSEVRKGKSVSAGDRMLCIRGGRSPTDARLTYAVIFRDGDYIDYRPSIILDECETQTYTALAPAAGSVPAPVPNPAPAPAKHQKRHQVQQ
jgi:hypothetical protein